MPYYETQHHYIYIEVEDPPEYVCTGNCKSIWWPTDIPTPGIIELPRCPKCGGSISAAQAKDYRMLDLIPELQNQVKQYQQSNHRYKLSHLAAVKPEFEEQAKKGWQ